jgi:hypothetical protein
LLKRKGSKKEATNYVINKEKYRNDDRKETIERTEEKQKMEGKIREKGILK